MKKKSWGRRQVCYKLVARRKSGNAMLDREPNGPLFVIVAAVMCNMPAAPLLTGLPPRLFRHWRRSALPPAEPQDRYESNTEEKNKRYLIKVSLVFGSPCWTRTNGPLFAERSPFAHFVLGLTLRSQNPALAASGTAGARCGFPLVNAAHL